MADWTAITGIVVSGVVGPSVLAGFAAWRQKREAEHDITLADRAAARVLMDDAAQAMREALGRGGVLSSAFMTWGAKLGSEGGADEVAAFNEAGRRVDLLEPRVAIMFGADSQVADAFTDCFKGLDRMAKAVHVIRVAGEHADLQEEWQNITQGLEGVDVAHRHFLEAAHEAIGVRRRAGQIRPAERSRVAS